MSNNEELAIILSIIGMICIFNFCAGCCYYRCRSTENKVLASNYLGHFPNDTEIEDV